jgi:ABC-2 type transport system permease protein
MDHLLAMPLTPFEIAMSKVWANGLVITVAVGLSLYVVVRAILGFRSPARSRSSWSAW